MPEVDTSNRCSVRRWRECIASPLFIRNLTQDEALNLAAWLTAIVDPTREKFDSLLKEILK